MARRKRRNDGDLVPFADAVADTPDDYLDCRDLRHPWADASYRVNGGEVERSLVCARCGTVRNDRWTLGGERVGSSYQYAEGYQFVGLLDGPDATAVRREVIRRHVDAPTRRRKRR